uniref:Uncharacterized protein n=1 Tax=Oryza glumipatula TaxID=40148 RepID=A0A0E0B941_9ORYZ
MSSQSNIDINWGAKLEDWQKLTCNGPIEDVTYYIGPLGEGFYVLTNKEDLLLYTPNTNNHPGELTMSSMEMYSVCDVCVGHMRRGDFCCPTWVTTDARKLIKMLLDPNPGTRITVVGLLETCGSRRMRPSRAPSLTSGWRRWTRLARPTTTKDEPPEVLNAGGVAGTGHGARARHAVRDVGAVEQRGRAAGGACNWQRHAHARDEEWRRAGAGGGSPWRQGQSRYFKKFLNSFDLEIIKYCL